MSRLVGACRIDTILDIDFDPTFSFLFPGRDVGELAPFLGWLEPEHVDIARGVVRLDVASSLLRIGGRVILVDGGIGEGKERHRPEWHLRRETGFLERLRRPGVRPQDVDTVICTHFHVDHVGWFTTRSGDGWEPTFANAAYLVGETELATWQEKIASGADLPPYMVDSVIPLLDSGRMRAVPDDHGIAPGVRLVLLAGHTLGQVGVRIDSDGVAAVLSSDALHNPFQIFLPDWSSALCQDAELARRTRRALLADCADTGRLLMPAHLRGIDALRIERQGDRFIPVPVDLPPAETVDPAAQK